MKTIIQHVVTIPLLTTTMLLTACGGGGGGSSATTSTVSGVSYTGPTTDVTVDETTGGSIVSGASSVGTSSQLSGGSLVGVVSVSGSMERPALTTIAKQLAQRAFTAPFTPASSSSAGITRSSSGPLNCPTSGSMTVTAIDNDDSGATVTNGDALEMRFSNCKDGTSLLNGGFTFTFTTLGIKYTTTGDLDGTSFTIDMDEFKTSDSVLGTWYLMDGDMTMSVTRDPIIVNSVSYMIDGTSLYMADSSGYQSLLESFVMTDTDNSLVDGTLARSFEFDLTSTEIGGHVYVKTIDQFEITLGGSYPHSGQLEVTGLGGAKARLTADDAINVTIEFDINPVDGIYEPVSTINTTWAAIDN